MGILYYIFLLTKKRERKATQNNIMSVKHIHEKLWETEAVNKLIKNLLIKLSFIIWRSELQNWLDCFWDSLDKESGYKWVPTVKSQMSTKYMKQSRNLNKIKRTVLKSTEKLIN